MTREEIQKNIVEFLKARNAKKIGLFGSFARNEETEKSDIDVLVSFREGVNFFDLVGMELDLSDLVGKKIDLVEEEGINKRLKPSVERDLQILYQ